MFQRDCGLVRACTSVLFAVAAISCAEIAEAQTSPESPYQFILTPERVRALVRAANENLDHVPGEVLVKFRDGVTPFGQQRALSALRSQPPVSGLRWRGSVAVVTDLAEPDATVLAAELSAQPEVEYAEPNYLYRVHRTPDDPSFASRQWNFSAIDLPRAWDINDGANPSVVVAVLDTGITTVNQTFAFQTWDGVRIRNVGVPFAVNPDLQASRLGQGQDFVFWTGPVLDMEGHGTHVSSTVGEDTNNTLALAGIAYNARILPVKVCLGYWDIQFLLSALGEQGFAPQDAGGCDTAAIAEGLRFAADAGAKVINMSLGGPGPSLTIRDALEYAVGKGAFVAISMGNEFEDGNPINFPAAYAEFIDGAMAVGAVGRSLNRAFYSSTGSHVEIAAPGGDFRDGGTGGLIWQGSISPTDSDSLTVIFPRFDRYVERPEQGTSMAAPHVAGTAALIVSQGVTDPAAIEAIIKGTARNLGAEGHDTEYGHGLIQPRTALFGFGLVR
jgi:serine protease